jgi:hypothetical protein
MYRRHRDGSSGDSSSPTAKTSPPNPRKTAQRADRHRYLFCVLKIDPWLPMLPIVCPYPVAIRFRDAAPQGKSKPTSIRGLCDRCWHTKFPTIRQRTVPNWPGMDNIFEEESYENCYVCPTQAKPKPGGTEDWRREATRLPYPFLLRCTARFLVLLCPVCGGLSERYGPPSPRLAHTDRSLGRFHSRHLSPPVSFLGTSLVLRTDCALPRIPLEGRMVYRLCGSMRRFFYLQSVDVSGSYQRRLHDGKGTHTRHCHPQKTRFPCTSRAPHFPTKLPPRF